MNDIKNAVKELRVRVMYYASQKQMHRKKNNVSADKGDVWNRYCLCSSTSKQDSLSG